MESTRDVSLAYTSLNRIGNASIGTGKDAISLYALDHGVKFKMTTPIYLGHNYIPQSVRSGIKNTQKLQQYGIKTFLQLEEDNHQITLNYLGQLDQLNLDSFYTLVVSFEKIAEQWREFLDEQDRRDLIHIPL